MAIVIILASIAAVSWGSSFTALMDQMVKKDPEFQSVDLDSIFYDAKVKQGYSRLFLPRVGLNYSINEQHNNTSQVLSAEKYKITSLDARWSLFKFGSDWSFLQSTRFEKKAQDARIKKRYLEKENQIGRIYLSFLKEKRNLIIISNILDLKKKSLALSEQRFKSGNLSEQDLSKIKLDVSNAKGEYLLQEQVLRQAMATLKPYLENLDYIDQNFPWTSLLTKELLNQLLDIPFVIEKIPAYQEIQFQMDSLEYLTKSSLADMLGGFSFNFSRARFEFERQELYEWRTSINYSLPLFDQFDQYANYQQTRLKKISQQFHQTFAAKRFKETALAESDNIKTAIENFIERDKALKLSQKLYHDSLKQFNRGQLSVNELLVDQDRLLRTEQLANMSLHQAHEQYLHFCHSRGRSVVQGCP